MPSISEILKNFILQVHEGALTTLNYPNEWGGLQMVVSFGEGAPARVPWIALFAPEMQVSQGFYPVYFFYRASNRLILSYGISETAKYPTSWPTEVSKHNPRIREYLSGGVPRYGDSFVFNAYTPNVDGEEVSFIRDDSDQVATSDEIERDLKEITEFYKKVVSSSTSVTGTVLAIPDDNFMVEQDSIEINAFEEICQKGSRAGWCWRITCTTCRADKYRRTLRHLRTGNRIGRNDHDYPRERLGWWHFNLDLLNESSSPEERRKYKAAEAEVEKGFRVLENVLCDASLWNIATDYWQGYADRTVNRMSMGRNHWLACIGIALDECPSRKVTESWITQLSQMLGWRSKFLSDIWFDSEKLLRWTDLEQFEHRIVRRKSPVESRVDQEDLAQYWDEYREYLA